MNIGQFLQPLLSGHLGRCLLNHKVSLYFKYSIILIFWAAVIGSRCCGILATFSLLFCLITLMYLYLYLYYVGKTNKINKINQFRTALRWFSLEVWRLQLYIKETQSNHLSLNTLFDFFSFII